MLKKAEFLLGSRRDFIGTFKQLSNSAIIFASVATVLITFTAGPVLFLYFFLAVICLIKLTDLNETMCVFTIRRILWTTIEVTLASASLVILVFGAHPVFDIIPHSVHEVSSTLIKVGGK